MSPLSAGEEAAVTMNGAVRLGPFSRNYTPSPPIAAGSFKTDSAFSRSVTIPFLSQVDNGDLRPYSDLATKSFLADLRDGFFPSEFKTSDPDGLLIRALDHR